MDGMGNWVTYMDGTDDTDGMDYMNDMDDTDGTDGMQEEAPGRPYIHNILHIEKHEQGMNEPFHGFDISCWHFM